MIRFHGGPITPNEVCEAVWTARHACVSWYRPDQEGTAFEVAQSVMLDNGAFSAWGQGSPITDWSDYAEWVKGWRQHPAFAFAIIPDVIDGSEGDNDTLIAWWRERVGFAHCVPVWHFNESLARLRYMARAWPRIALGSSGEYADIGTEAWWARMTEVMDTVCDGDGRPTVKLHGLRMMNATVFSAVPLSSCDSTNIAQNHVRQRRNGYRDVSAGMAVRIFANRMEQHVVAARWNPSHDGHRFNLELIG